MQSPVVNVLVHLMLSQARECVVQQLLLDYTPDVASDQTYDLLRGVELAQDCATVCPSVFTPPPVGGRVLFSDDFFLCFFVSNITRKRLDRFA